MFLYIFYHFCSSFWSFTSFLKDSVVWGIIKPALRIDWGHLPVELLRGGIVKQGLLSIKYLVWSWVFYNNDIAPGLYSEVLAHRPLRSASVFIHLAQWSVYTGKLAPRGWRAGSSRPPEIVAFEVSAAGGWDTLKEGGRRLDFLSWFRRLSPFHCVAKGTALKLHFCYLVALSFGETQAVWSQVGSLLGSWVPDISGARLWLHHTGMCRAACRATRKT